MPTEITEGKIEITGKRLEDMPHDLRIIAALVKRLGGEVILADKEVAISNFKGVMLQLSKHGSIIIRVS